MRPPASHFHQSCSSRGLSSHTCSACPPTWSPARYYYIHLTLPPFPPAIPDLLNGPSHGPPSSTASPAKPKQQNNSRSSAAPVASPSDAQHIVTDSRTLALSLLPLYLGPKAANLEWARPLLVVAWLRRNQNHLHSFPTTTSLHNASYSPFHVILVNEITTPHPSAQPGAATSANHFPISLIGYISQREIFFINIIKYLLDCHVWNSINSINLRLSYLILTVN